MSLTLIGDSKQTLYMFRNANPDILEKMDKLISDSQEGCILKNYRSPKQLVMLSNYFSEVFKGDLKIHGSDPFKEVEDHVLEVNQYDTVISESRNVSREISNLRKNGIDLKDIAILARTNRQLLDFEAGLITEQIPYIIKYDSRSVLNQSSFKVLYSIYSLMINPKDINALCEIILPIKGIGVKFIEELRGKVLFLLRKGVDFSVFDHINVETLGKNTKQYQILCSFVDKVLKAIWKVFRQENTNFLSLNFSIQDILNNQVEFDNEKNYDSIARLTITRDAFNRAFSTFSKIYRIALEDFEFKKQSEFQRFVKIYEMLQMSQEAYMDYRNQKRSDGDKKSAVILSTIHSYKGKEAPYVFVVCLRSYQDINKDSFENKCVFYVSVTRAKKKLYLSSSNLIRSFKGELIRAGDNPFIRMYVGGISRMKEELGKEL